MHLERLSPIADYARFASAYTDPRLGIPIIVGVESEQIGGATGYGEKVHAAAVAELLERKHFKVSLQPRGTLKLGEMKDAELAASFLVAFQQTSGLPVSKLSNMELGAVKCTRLLDGKSATLPIGTISMGDLSKNDKIVLPKRDSSGSAIHSSPRLSLEGALCEFIERQTMLAAWIGGNRSKKIIGIDEDTRPLGEAKGIWNLLRAAGDIDCLLLDAGLGAYVVFSAFYSKDPDGEVQFACGLACHWDSTRAIQKSLLELWHVFLATPIKMEEAEKDSSRIHGLDRHFLTFNEVNVRNRIRFRQNFGPQENNVLWSEYCKLKYRGCEASIHKITEISRNIFLYQGVETTQKDILVASKIFSPDFFLHIDPSTSFNLNNPFSEKIDLDVSSFDGTPTCFP